MRHESLASLAEQLSRGALSSEQLTESVLASGSTANARVNGFAYLDPEHALAQARAIDKRRKSEVLGPLAGLPLTIKDNIDVAALPSTQGMPSRKDHVAQENAPIVEALVRAGAVILGKSNVPQALASGAESSNPLHGETRNPWGKHHGPGGSSGGEAALIAAGASLAGVGADLGGSIRTPAAYCGIAGLKPTTHHWSNYGVSPAMPGQEILQAQVGPMARTAQDVAFLFEAVDNRSMARVDPRVVPRSAQKHASVSLSGMRFGFYESDGWFQPSLACRRAVNEAADYLANAGAEIIPVSITDQDEVTAICLYALSADGMRTFAEVTKQDPLKGIMRKFMRVGELPQPLKQAASRLVSLIGESRLAELIPALGDNRVDRYWRTICRKREFQRREMARWNRLRLDGMLCPATATPAAPIGLGEKLGPLFGYTSRYNLLDFPAGVVSTTRVRAHETARSVTADSLDRAAAAVDAASLGLPVAVQVAARPCCENVILAALVAIENAAARSSDYPLSPRSDAMREAG